MDASPNLATMLLKAELGEAAPSAKSPASPAAVPVAAERVCAYRSGGPAAASASVFAAALGAAAGACSSAWLFFVLAVIEAGNVLERN